VIGAERNGKKFNTWLDNDDTHVLLIGATRSGKSRKVIMPTIWTLAHAGESMVMADPKGELYKTTSKYLQSKGYNVIVLNLREPTMYNHWNPLQPAISALADGDTIRASQAAKQIAHLITYKDQPPKEYKGDPIWPQTQRSMTAAIALLVAKEAPEPARHFGSVYKTLITLGQNGGKALDKFFNQLPDNHIAKDAYGVASMAEDRLKNSVFTGTAAQLELWSDPGVIWMTAFQDHDMDAPGREKTAVYLIAPDEDDTLHVLTTLYIQQMYQALIRLAQHHGDRLPIKVNFLLDEFGNMPPISDFDRKLTMAAGRNIRLLLAIQGLDQIAYHYPRLYKTIAGNCATWIYISTADVETAQMISKRLGQYTVKTENYSSQAQSYRHGHSHSISHGLTGRPLLLPDEIMRWPKDQALITKTSQYPARLPLLDVSKWPAITDFIPVDKPREGVTNERAEIWVPQLFNFIPEEQNETNMTEPVNVQQESTPKGNIFDD